MRVGPDVMHPGGPIAPWKLRAWEMIVPRLPRRVMRFAGRLVFRLPLGSRARRWCVVGLCQIGWETTARSRFDLVLPIWDPDCEWLWDPRFRGLGFDEVYRGHDGVRRSVLAWNEVWEDPNFTIREILDGGNTLLMRMTASGRGIGSGAPVEVEVNSIAHLDPFVVRFYNIADYDEALREAGFV